ncbi:MAG TPA: DUF4160 domain-containing protein [Actinomycetota bacterium]|nr:DUF4160 domain-containing protein [Actinomycetota bacterium]
MPAISRFYGIAIFMYWRDHSPPHYHAIYGEHEAIFLVEDGSLLYGSLPRRALRFVQTWHRLHPDELLEAWGRAQAGLAVGTIEPLP